MNKATFKAHYRLYRLVRKTSHSIEWYSIASSLVDKGFIEKLVDLSNKVDRLAYACKWNINRSDKQTYLGA